MQATSSDPVHAAIDTPNAVFAGSAVHSGNATAIAVLTGSHTELGQIGANIAKREKPTAFDMDIQGFGMFIMRLPLFLVLFVLLINALFHRPWLESFMFAVALAVGLTPELLPMIVSVTLARGAMRLAQKHVIVKQLPVIQNLGTMDVFCCDNTGTLTEAEIRLDRTIDLEGIASAPRPGRGGAVYQGRHKQRLDPAGPTPLRLRPAPRRGARAGYRRTATHCQRCA
ncbi:hypothetical protein G6F57_016911 [Rhizopus arrhizus]|nr:hypothetical protein G6F57_016911 [Rhizopus arrhizus]